MAKKDRLYQLLEQLDHDDLLFLLQNGLGKSNLKFAALPDDRLKDIVSAQLRNAASNSFANYFRLEHEYPYRRILLDVVKRLSEGRGITYGMNGDFSDEEIELEILRLFEKRVKDWWTRLNDEQKDIVSREVERYINADMINTVNRRAYIKYRVKKELVDSIITKGLVVSLVAVSGGGVVGILGGSLLTQIGWKIVVGFTSLLSGLPLLIAKKAYLTFIGTLAVGLCVFVPSTIFFHAGTNYKKTIPTVIMLLSRIHLHRLFTPPHEHPEMLQS